MWSYFARRFLIAIPTLLCSTFIVFLIVVKAPGGPVEAAILRAQMGGNMGGGEAGGGASSTLGSEGISEKAIEEIKRYYGVHLPFHKQYLRWLSNIVRLDFGRSYKYEEDVWDLLKQRFPISVSLGLIGFFLSYSICIPLGIAKAVKHNTSFDFATSALVFAGYSIPGWALGILLLMIFASPDYLAILPLSGFRPQNWDKLDFTQKCVQQFRHVILPITAYMAGSFATLTVLTKNSLMENLGQDYVRTAFAKGLTERRVIVAHAMRNSLIPLATGLGHLFSLVLAGSYLIEKVFGIDGMGMLGFNAILNKDQNIVMGILLISTSLNLFGNIMQDVLYCIFDPRIRFN